MSSHAPDDLIDGLTVAPTEHTPGGWVFDGFAYVWQGEDIKNVGGMVSDASEFDPWVQRMRGTGRDIPHKELIANGHLIAAAPALLEAARDAIWTLRYLHRMTAVGTPKPDSLIKLEQAYAKARKKGKA